MKKFLPAVLIAILALATTANGQFTGNKYAAFDDFTIVVLPANDSLVTIEVIETGNAVPKNSLRYPPVQKSTARWIVQQWAEKQMRARAAAEYQLLVAKMREAQVKADAEDVGIASIADFAGAAVLPGFAGKWAFLVDSKRSEFEVSKNGAFTFDEGPGAIEAISAFEFLFKANGTAIRFVSADGEVFAANVGGSLYTMARLRN